MVFALGLCESHTSAGSSPARPAWSVRPCSQAPCIEFAEFLQKVSFVNRRLSISWRFRHSRRKIHRHSPCMKEFSRPSNGRDRSFAACKQFTKAYYWRNWPPRLHERVRTWNEAAQGTCPPHMARASGSPSSPSRAWRRSRGASRRRWGHGCSRISSRGWHLRDRRRTAAYRPI